MIAALRQLTATGRLVALLVACTAGQSLSGEPVISEFLAVNGAVLTDEDGTFSDWIEVFNPDPAPVNLGGWYLTDNATNKTRWQFPAVTVPAGGYLVVFASNKNRRDPAGRLHTNFALDADGEYLALVRPDGVSVASEYAPRYPRQTADVSYGVALAPNGTVARTGYFRTPTPGTANGDPGPLELTETVTFSHPAGVFAQPFNLALAGAASGQRIRFQLYSPAVTQVDTEPPSSAWMAYTGPISVTSTVVVRAAVFSEDGSLHGPVVSAEYVRLDSSLAAFASRLPVLVLDNQGEGAPTSGMTKFPGWAFAFPASPSAPAFSQPAVASAAELSVRGSSSAAFPKKSFNVDFRDSRGGERAVSMFEMPELEEWAVVGPWFYDRSLIHNSFMYTLAETLGHWAPRTRLAEMFFNTDGDALEASDHAGVYVFTDRIQVGRERVDIARLSASDNQGTAVTGGYIIKFDPPDSNEIAWRTQRGIPDDDTASIILVAPSASNVTSSQQTYIRDYVQRMEDALHADAATGFGQRTYLDYIDRPSWVDFHLLQMLAANPDAFYRSTFFHKDRGGKLKAGPIWDFDRALGSYEDERSFRWDLWSGVGVIDGWRIGWWGVLAQDPEFMQEWVDRWQALRRNQLTEAALHAIVDQHGNSIDAAIAAREAATWPGNGSPFGSHAGEIAHLKSWLTNRLQWIDQQFVAPPSAVVSGNAITFTPPAGAQLVYTRDGSDPRRLGGEIAPNAQVASGPVTLSASDNLEVRAYRADLRGMFPGSPWSAAVGGPSSTPLRPHGRLVNLSSRGVVGMGENSLIAGVVVADTAAKRYLARGIGPALAAFGTAGVVPDPQLSLFAGTTELARNLGWQTSADASALPALFTSLGAFQLPAASLDSALAREVSAGAYTMQITSPSGRPGVGLAELYEADGYGRTTNLSTRALVQTGAAVLIGGFVSTGPAHKRLLLRAVGPTLGTFGVTNALADPVLTIFSGSTVVATNDRWSDANAAPLIAAAGEIVQAFPLATNSQDAALLITLPPGTYTVEVRGKANAEGVALLEIYDLP